MGDIQNISITATETVPQPKPHTVYVVQVSTPTRTWTVSRRYNDFVSLHAELLSSAGKAPPAPLPPKHAWSLTKAVNDDKMIRERRILLEQYLRSILTTKDARWRASYGFADFLAVPHAGSSRSGASAAQRSGTGDSADDPPTHFSPSTWLLESQTVSSLLRTARGALLKRDALAGMADAAGSRTAGVEAKRTLRDVAPRIEALDKALGTAGMKGLGEGERRRREEMVEGMRSERDGLVRMAEAGVRTGSALTAAGAGGSGRGSPAHAQSGSSHTMPGAFGSTSSAPKGRFFGTPPPPEETAETRPLDDRQLLQLQQTKMDGQDQALGELSKLLQTQRKMGEEIHQEISEQNEMLDDLQSGVDRTEGRLGRAKRQLNKLNS